MHRLDGNACTKATIKRSITQAFSSPTFFHFAVRFNYCSNGKRMTRSRSRREIQQKFAAAFIDQSDERKPMVLLVSDQKIPVEKWIPEGFLLLPSNFRVPLDRPAALLPSSF
jgi:hypothetical protein